MRRLEVQLKSQIFDGHDPLSILGFLLAVHMALDTNGIHEDAAMWLFHFFTKELLEQLSIAVPFWPVRVVHVKRKDDAI